MVSFIGLYRGPSLSAAQLVGVSADPALVAHVAGALLAERERDGGSTEDAATVALTEGKRRALELVRDEAEALRQQPLRGRRRDHARAAGSSATSAPATSMARERSGTLSGAALCEWEGCRRRLPPRRGAGGSPRRFCGPRCRKLAWEARHANGAADDATAPLVSDQMDGTR